MFNAIFEPVSAMALKKGDIVRDHGAYFVVDVVKQYNVESPDRYQANLSVWIGGATIPGYFGPMDGYWNLQGNENAIYWRKK
jgi:hypothetical protein